MAEQHLCTASGRFQACLQTISCSEITTVRVRAAFAQPSVEGNLRSQICCLNTFRVTTSQTEPSVAATEKQSQSQNGK